MNSAPGKSAAGDFTQLNDADSSQKLGKAAPPSGKGPAVGGWVRDVVISLASSAFFIVFLYQPVKVEGTSMMPTLQDQERVFINKFVYRLHFGKVDRGDTVVFWFPGDPTKSNIKRRIGVPGDRVEVSLGCV